MKKAALLFAVLTVVMWNQGCSMPEQYKIEEIQNVLILGLDSSNDEIRATIVVDSIQEGGKAGEKKVTYKAYTMTGRTMLEISRKFHEVTNKRITYYHMKYVIFGEDAARNGLEKYLNFILEDHEPTSRNKLLVSRGETAKEFIEQTSSQDASLAGYLDSLYVERSSGKTSEVTATDYAISSKRPWTSFYIPVVQPDSSSEVQTGSSQSSQDSSSQSGGTHSTNVKLEGYAIFKGDQLVDYMDGDAAMGTNIILNELKSANITVQDIKGQNASLEIMKSEAKITPEYGDPLSVKIKVSIEANLDEYFLYQDITKEDFVSYLEDQGCANVQAIIVQAVLQAQRNKSDMLGIGEAFYHKDPAKWQAIKDTWPDIFAGVKVTVEVDLDIKRTYYLGAAEKG